MALVFAEFGYTWGKLMRRKCVGQLFPVSVRYAEDFLFYISNLPYFESICCLDYSGYHYRVRPGSLSVKSPSDVHTKAEFYSKNTFLAYVRQQDFFCSGAAADPVCNHIFYICLLQTLLYARLRKSGIRLPKEEMENLRSSMRRYFPSFLRITGKKQRRLKRFFFGLCCLIWPYGGGLLASKLLRQ